MFHDDFKFERELEVIDFINNKIKRCRKCGTELHYKEKFYNTDKICNRCKGRRSCDEIDVNPLAVQNKNNHISAIQNVKYALLLADNIEKKRITTEKDFLEKYTQWQLNNEKAEKAWKEKQASTLSDRKKSKSPSITPNLTDERLGEIISNYDSGEGLNVSHDELISIVWEVMYHRGINKTF